MKVKKNQIRLLLGALLVITSIVIGQHTRGERQPSFQGKSLSFWLDQYLFNRGAGNDPEKLALREDARRAIRQIGSNGIPYLLKMLCER
ncbi:MAG TPA: hypothetical protein VNU68_32205, partial [Verrucomicrobiae bacterium]|nr:hypothetical protein [Verrucomicrobiae bacterium]